MLLQPRKFQYSKMQRRKVGAYGYLSASEQNSKISFGSVGLATCSSGYVTPLQVESLRKMLLNFKHRSFKFWVRLMPYIAKTAYSSESRMGKGRGKTTQWVSFVKKGQILFEFQFRQGFYFHPKFLKPLQSKLSLRLKLVNSFYL